jgi:hypothetical protein
VQFEFSQFHVRALGMDDVCVAGFLGERGMFIASRRSREERDPGTTREVSLHKIKQEIR